MCVPPYILQAIVQNTEGETREYYQNCLIHQQGLHSTRTTRFGYLCQPPAARRAAGNPPSGHDQGAGGSTPGTQKHPIVPPHLLESIARGTTGEDHDNALKALGHAESIRQKRLGASEARKGDQDIPDEDKPKDEKFYRAVYDAENSMNEEDLPGKKVRVEGEEAIKDEAVNEAYDNAGHVLKFYKEKFDWQSIDNKNMGVVSSVHFGKKYGNAFWDPEKQQMVYGDGDNFLHNFTKCIDVIGHEMTHAVTEYTTPLDYQGQAGALNEHVSDVWGIMVKQMVEDEKADEADWLIGEGCLLPSVKGVALRNMAKPGTAYDDKVLGKDPQPDNFKDYTPMYEDNGGVHVYSGIPNRAFYLASVAFGGYSWEKAGQIWWETMQNGHLGPKSTFKQFANATIDVAEEKFGAEGKKILTEAWEKVGVKESSS